MVEAVSQDKCKVVVQRVNSCSLLLDNDSEWGNLGRSLVVSISFTNVADETVIPKVVKGILNMPILTFGSWGDGRKPVSLSTAVADGRQDVGLMVIPAAGLTCKLKGKYIQYRGQCNKEYGAQLYQLFKTTLVESLEHMATGGKKKKEAAKRPAGTPASTMPAEMFSLPPFEGQYTKYDEQGMPTHDKTGKELSKSQLKKLKKLHAKQIVRYEKYLKTSPPPTTAIVLPESKSAKEQNKTGTAGEPAKGPVGNIVNDYPVKCVFGTYGNRQGLKIDAECGPFTHTFSFS